MLYKRRALVWWLWVIGPWFGDLTARDERDGNNDQKGENEEEKASRMMVKDCGFLVLSLALTHRPPHKSEL